MTLQYRTFFATLGWALVSNLRSSMSQLQIKNQVIMPLDKARDLGVIIDSKLTMESHTASVARSCFYQLRQLRSIQRSLTTDARRTCTLVTAFVANRVDYCNAVLYGSATSVTRRLQMVLNYAARMVVGSGKYEHITPVLRDILHWLPVRIAVLTFDCVRGTGPVYLKQARGFGIVTSVTPFGWSRRPVRFAGKHVHRPAKLLHRGSCRLERTST